MKKLFLTLLLISLAPLYAEITFSRTSQNPEADLEQSFLNTIEFLQKSLDSAEEMGIPSSMRKFSEDYILKVLGDDASIDINQRTFAAIKITPALITIYFLRAHKEPFIINQSRFVNLSKPDTQIEDIALPF